MPHSINFRPLNVVLRPQSPAVAAYAAVASPTATVLAQGFAPRPDLDLTFRGGHTIRDLVFVNQYLGAPSAWPAGARSSIDEGLSALMSDPGLETVIAQYYPGHPISSRMLPSGTVAGTVGHRYYKDQAEAAVTQLFQHGVLGTADPASSVICLLLPPGAILVDGLSHHKKGAAPAVAEQAVHARPARIDDEQVDSLHGLGGYHGSVHVGGTTVYYAISVYSQGTNGIDVFDTPWKNVVATLYHELCEARTDPDVEDVIHTGDASKLGWYSDHGGEIGDIPMSLAGPNLSEVMKEVKLADGLTEPMQLQWSNRVHGPEGI